MYASFVCIETSRHHYATVADVVAVDGLQRGASMTRTIIKKKSGEGSTGWVIRYDLHKDCSCYHEYQPICFIFCETLQRVAK